MTVENKGNSCIVTSTQNAIADFLGELTFGHDRFAKDNLIVDISQHKGLSVKEINAFLPLSKVHAKSKKSFVIVADVDFNRASDKLVIVPTLQEAHDIIEMDEIERDLGF